MTKLVVYPGTFDPIHNGHLDIARRASHLFDELMFVVADNVTKAPLFTPEERIAMIQESTKELTNVKVSSTKKLVVEYAHSVNAIALIRGLRHVSDFEFEFQMAMMNYHLDPDITTILMMPDEKYIHLNSTVVKDVARLEGDVSEYVPAIVQENLNLKFNH